MVSQPSAEGEAPTIDVAVGYSKSNTSPKRSVSHTTLFYSELVTHVHPLRVATYRRQFPRTNVCLSPLDTP